MDLCSILNFLHAYFDKVKFCTCPCFHRTSNLFSVNKCLPSELALRWEGNKKKKILHFDLKKKKLLYWNVPQSGHIFLLCSTELKKRPKGTRYIMSNLTRQCLTGLKILNIPNWWELKLTGFSEGHSLGWKWVSYKVLQFDQLSEINLLKVRHHNSLD